MKTIIFCIAIIFVSYIGVQANLEEIKGLPAKIKKLMKKKKSHAAIAEESEHDDTAIAPVEQKDEPAQEQEPVLMDEEEAKRLREKLKNCFYYEIVYHDEGLNVTLEANFEDKKYRLIDPEHHEEEFRNEIVAAYLVSERDSIIENDAWQAIYVVSNFQRVEDEK